MVYIFKHFGLLMALMISSLTFAQTKAKDYIIEGNDFYGKGKFDEAEYAYKRAAIEDPTSVKANYNLGNALYQQKRYKESISHFNRSAEIAKNKDAKHAAYHNAGNAYLEEKDYEKAVESFKKALKNDPYDESTRYNLAYAKKLLERKKENQKQQNQNNSEQNQDKNNNQNNQQQNQDQENNNQQQNNKNQQDQENQAGKSQRENEGGNPKSGGQNGDQKGNGKNSSPEIKQGSKGDGSEQNNAQNNIGEGMLKALQEQEARTQRKVIQQKADKQNSKTSKDW